MTLAEARARGRNKRYILNRIIRLEEEKQGALEKLARARGDRALQLRAHVVVLERSLRWYRGRLERQNRASGATRAQERAYGRASRTPLVGAVRVNPGAVRLPTPTHQSRGGGQMRAWIDGTPENRGAYGVIRTPRKP